MSQNIPPHITKDLLINFCKFAINSQDIELKLSDDEWLSLYQQFRNGRPSMQVYGVVYLNWKVAKYFGLYPEDLLLSVTKSRRERVVRPRHVACYIMKEFGFTYKTIAKYYGYKTYTTALHAHKTVIRDMDTDPKFKEKIVDLFKEFGVKLQETPPK